MKLKDALGMLKPFRMRMTIIMALAVVLSVISAVTPFMNRNMIDNGLLKNNIRTVIVFILIIIVLQMFGYILEFIQRKQEIEITNALGKKLKAEAFMHGIRLKPSYFSDEGFYKTIGDALYDISNIMMIADNSFLTIFVIIAKCIGAIVGLFILDWRLAIFVFALIPVKYLINVAVRKRAEKLGEQLMDDNKVYNSWFSNIIHGLTDIKLWNMEKKSTDEYAAHVETINNSSKKLSLLQEKNGLLTRSLELIMTNSLYILGAYLISGGRLTFGGLVAFISFTAYVLTPVNTIMHLRIILKRISPSLEGIKRFYKLEEENYAASLPIPGEISTIEFRNISITLGGRDILKNINMKIQKGDKVAVVGDNGSGKTTLINLLLRLCEPSEGEILVDDVPINTYNIEDYRHKFSVVTQDIHLFKGSVRENITLNESETINKDMRLKFCTEVIENWAQNYETQVGSEGMKLSGGERQKLALLRALNRKSQILILDEPTSNYDKCSAIEFNEFIKKNRDYDFYFIITHWEGNS